MQFQPKLQKARAGIDRFHKFEDQSKDITDEKRQAHNLSNTHDKLVAVKRERVPKFKEGKAEDDEITEQHLEDFINSAAQEHNLFYLDPHLTTIELEERIDILSSLLEVYSSSSSEQRNHVEQIVNDMFGTPQITREAQQYIDNLSDSLPDEDKPSGAENRNLIYTNEAGVKGVLKITKGRHAEDFTSVLKLMRNMHMVMLRLNQDPVRIIDGPEVAIEATARDMLVYKDEEKSYQRIVRQPFAEGKSIKDLTDEERADPDFKMAWAYFLDRIKSMQDKDGIIMDINDSDAGYKKQRANVGNTGNVFVEIQGNRFKFQVIDPDVFDTVPGEHKFDPSETAHSRFGFGSPWKALTLRAMNYFRDVPLVKWQDEFIEAEQKKARNDEKKD